MAHIVDENQAQAHSLLWRLRIILIASIAAAVLIPCAYIWRMHAFEYIALYYIGAVFNAIPGIALKLGGYPQVALEFYQHYAALGGLEFMSTVFRLCIISGLLGAVLSGAYLFRRQLFLTDQPPRIAEGDDEHDPY